MQNFNNMSNNQFNLKNTKELSIDKNYTNKEIHSEMVDGEENIIVSAGFRVRDRMETRMQFVVGFTSNFNCIENGVLKAPHDINQKIYINKERKTVGMLNAASNSGYDSIKEFVYSYFFIKDQLTNMLSHNYASDVFYIVCKLKLPDSNEFYYSLKRLHEIETV